jgi:hypothetical protein
MNDDLHYGIAPIDLGTFRSANNPRRVKSETSGCGWVLFVWFFLATGVQAFGWVVWL